jgi:hypothetical protein
LKVDTEMYPRILWELVVDPKGSADHTLETTGLDENVFVLKDKIGVT